MLVSIFGIQKMKKPSLFKFHQIFGGIYQMKQRLKDLKRSKDVAAASFFILIIFRMEGLCVFSMDSVSTIFDKVIQIILKMLHLHPVSSCCLLFGLEAHLGFPT